MTRKAITAFKRYQDKDQTKIKRSFRSLHLTPREMRTDAINIKIVVGNEKEKSNEKLNA